MNTKRSIVYAQVKCAVGWRDLRLVHTRCLKAREKHVFVGLVTRDVALQEGVSGGGEASFGCYLVVGDVKKKGRKERGTDAYKEE